MKKYYLNTFILLLLPIFGSNSPIEYIDDISPPLYHDHPLNLNENLEKAGDEQFRLPNNTKPIAYKIQITTDVHESKTPGFSGTIDITLKALIDTANITLHGRQIEIKSAKLKDVEDDKEIVLKEFPKKPNEVNEFLVFELEDEKKPLKQGGQYILTIEYAGKLREDNGGFYLSKYVDETGKERYLATTQFESTDARHGFPCYDEPGIKATFEIEIIHGTEYKAISNTIGITELLPSLIGYSITKFEKSKEMSTYLVAFVVCDFDRDFQIDKKYNLEHSVYSRPGTEGDRKFALDSSISILNAIQEYVDYQYSFPKMDQISIPDFAAGAMENWGLVTYREEMLLYNEKNSTTRTKTVVANTIAHEYGHQWFGNLVSPKWWTYLWLNEGFASIFAYIGADLAYKDWDLMEHFIVAEYQRALRQDEGINKRPMTYYVEKPKDIVGLFDSVSYSKAACVIQMMRHYLGEDAFKKSLNHYLKKMQYKSAEEKDLFESFQFGAKANSKKLDITIEELMGSWTRQGGFPLITVERNYDKGTFSLKQEGFKSDKETGDDKRSWIVPINFASGKSPNFDNTSTAYLFKEKTLTIDPQDYEKFDKNDWLILNKQLTSYYRVNYDDKNWDLIIDALKKKPESIHKYNRAQLILDSYRLSLNKNLKLEKFFNLMEYLPGEYDYAPWSSADEALQFYKNCFHDHSDLYGKLQFFILKNVENLYKKLTINVSDKDKHFDKYLRTMAINWACTAGSQDCLNTTNVRLKKFIDDGEKIEPDLQSAIYCNGLKVANKTQFDYMFELLMKSNDQAERQLILSSLGCSHDREHLKQLVESSIDLQNNFRKQERITILKQVYSKSKDGFEVCVEFLKNHFEDYSKLPPGFGQTNPLNDAVTDLAKIVVSDNQKNLVDDLVKKLKDNNKIEDKLIEQINKSMEINLKWVKENEGNVLTFLKDFFSRNNGATQVVVSFMALFAVLFVTIKNTF